MLRSGHKASCVEAWIPGSVKKDVKLAEIADGDCARWNEEPNPESSFKKSTRRRNYNFGAH